MSEPTVVTLGNFTATHDGRQWVLTQPITRQARASNGGGEYQDEAVVGYYEDIGALARRLLEAEVSKPGTIKGVREFATAVQDARSRVTEAIYAASGWPERKKDELVPSHSPALPIVSRMGKAKGAAVRRPVGRR
jgi:hypothetical protein